MIENRINAELPFMATENIMMAAVKAGGDRQVLHEAIREHSMEAARQVKENGNANDLLERLKGDPEFANIADQIDDIVNPVEFIGRAPEQVVQFLENEIDPLLTEYADCIGGSDDEITV
jgi:adenylosuccinate lyase